MACVRVSGLEMAFNSAHGAICVVNGFDGGVWLRDIFRSFGFRFWVPVHVLVFPGLLLVINFSLWSFFLVIREVNLHSNWSFNFGVLILYCVLLCFVFGVFRCEYLTRDHAGRASLLFQFLFFSFVAALFFFYKRRGGWREFKKQGVERRGRMR